MLIPAETAIYMLGPGGCKHLEQKDCQPSSSSSPVSGLTCCSSEGEQTENKCAKFKRGKKQNAAMWAALLFLIANFFYYFLRPLQHSMSFSREYDTIKLDRVRFAPVTLMTGSNPAGETRSSACSCNVQQITSQGEESFPEGGLINHYSELLENSDVLR